MSITNIEYGSLASSETLNNNFNDLDGRISSLSESTITDLATINSNIASMSATLTNLNDNMTDSVESLNLAFYNSGLYMTRYVNGTSWYTAYYSDENKTNRIWLEQGFMTPSRNWEANESISYNFLQPFSDTNYTVIATSNNIGLNGNISYGNVAVEEVLKSSVKIGNDGAGTFAVRVFACGK